MTEMYPAYYEAFRCTVSKAPPRETVELLLFRQKLLDAAGDFVMFVADNQRIQHAGAGFQRIHRRINTQRRD